MSYWPPGMTTDPIGAWPGAFTKRRTPSRFTADLKSTMKILTKEQNALEAKNVRIQIAVPASQFRLDGMPYATAKPEHPGLILTMDTKHGPLSYPCDTFTTWQENLRAIALSLEALRRADEYGVTKHGEQYRGNLAIEATAVGVRFNDFSAAVVQIMQVTNWDRDAVTADLPKAIRTAKFRTHPDTITVDNDLGDYQRVVAAEQYLRETGAIA